MFYYYKNHYIEQGDLYCVYQADHRLTEEEIKDIHSGQPELLEETTIYEGEEPFTGYPIKEKDTIRPATDKELVELGIITLKEGEILEGDKIVYISKPSYQHKWNGEAWIIDETKLEEGQIIENGKIKYIAPPEEMLIPKWDFTEKVWKESATDFDMIKAQYDEYAGMDTPSTLKEMQMQDPALATELIDMLIELRGMMYSLQNPVPQTYKMKITLPQPSEKLKDFKNKFNRI